MQMRGATPVDYIKEIIEYIPCNEQEVQDKKIILDYIEKFPDNILVRDNEFAHITSSGFLMNKALDKVLMIHHNIRNTWAWTGGHVDGDTDFLHVAMKEAKEETGINTVTALSEKIVSIDILPVYGHVRRTKYVSAHLHLSVAYILITGEDETLSINVDENSGVKWFSVDKITEDNFDRKDVYLYQKLIHRAKELNDDQNSYNASSL
jgi:8-oxo-dGTP pyrophosphatase MutT (NUDIX family)